MKWTLRALFVASLLAGLTAAGAQEQTRKQTLCEQKGIVTSYSLAHRDEFTEAQMLELLKEDWETSLSELFGFASYVDMQRIIRDNYRKFGKKYKLANDDDTIDRRVYQEAQACARYGF